MPGGIWKRTQLSSQSRALPCLPIGFSKQNYSGTHTLEEAVGASPACDPQSDSYSWLCDVNPQHPASLESAEMVSPLVSFLKGHCLFIYICV